MNRKYSFLIFTLFLISCSIVYGQPRRYVRGPQPKFGYGVKGGANIAWQFSPGNEGNVVVKPMPGINLGGYCNYFFSRQIAVQAELMVSTKGSDWKDFYYHMKDIVIYLDLPVLFRYQINRNFNLTAGPQVSYRLKATQKDVDTGVKSDINGYYKSLDYAIIGGVGANFNNRINLTLMYQYGITSATMEYATSWYNSLVQISVGYRLSGR